ncbi:MAG TPA: alpha/beta hydrolase [Micromonosporaceae bacterium]|nr:alpha/beta hydrolase [Micromonosporaceae bacterium]
MKLHVHRSGAGDKTALLIHGGMADHRTWHAVEGALVARGYQVVAPDLRGHGHSARGEYRPDLIADDLVENLPSGADVAIGHSIGGLVLALAADRLQPRRAIYSDPAFRLRGLPPEALEMMRAMVDMATAELIRQANPRWSERDIEVELAAGVLFDRDFLTAVASFPDDYVPDKAVVPSLVQIAEDSLTIFGTTRDLLIERGFEVRVVQGTAHCIHRDDLAAFMDSLTGWI